MRYEKKRFELDEPVALPTPIHHKQMDGEHLYLATHMPAWVVLNDQESALMDQLIEGKTIRQTIESVCARYTDLTQADGLQMFKELLSKLYKSDFYNSLNTLADQEVQTVQRVQFHLTNRCNLRCKHCYMDSGITHYDEMELDEWKAIIDEVASRYDRWFCSFSGGEAMLYEHHMEILKYAKENGAETALISNGLLLTEEKVRELEPYLDTLQISLDGATSEVNDAIRGKGVHEAVMRALRILKNSKIRVGINVVLMESNAEDIRKNLPELLKKEFGDIKVDIDFSTLVREGRANSFNNPLDKLEFRSTMTETSQYFLEQENWMPTPTYRRHNCGYGNSWAIYSNGDISPCLSPRFIRGNLKRDGIANVLDAITKEREQSLVDRLPECKTCQLRYICGGRCHLSTLEKGLGIMQVDCDDTYKENVYRSLVNYYHAATV